MREMLRGTFIRGNLYSTLKQIEGRQSIFNQLPSVQNNPYRVVYFGILYSESLRGRNKGTE